MPRSAIRPSIAEPVNLPPPVGGWNTRDSLDAMDEDDAVILDNWWPGFGSCSTRYGSADYADTLGGSVKMLAEFNAGSNRKFIAGAGGKIWDISASGAGVSLAMGFTSDAWETAQFDDAAGGARMGLVNGSDAPQTYNGAAIAAMVVSGPGLTVANLNGIHIYKGRSYFWDDRTQDFWYSATNALGGVLAKFPLGRVQNTGGNITGMGTWSRDSGDGMEDLAVFFLSSGDVLVYDGDDPSSAAAWQLTERYSIGAPISKRGIRKIGGDLVLVTKAGYLTLNSVVAEGRVNEQRAALSSKIRGAALSATQAYAANFGWQVHHYPAKNMLLVNVPITGTLYQQHAMNTETRAWCRFTGMNSVCWALYNDSLYFGKSDGTVKKADTGRSDSSAPIVFDGQRAWNYLDDRRRTKRITGMREIVRFTSDVTYYTGANCDFKQVLTPTAQSLDFGGSSPWDTSPWDTSFWSEEVSTAWNWISVSDSGFNVSSRIQANSATAGIEWLSTAFLVEYGGNI